MDLDPSLAFTALLEWWPDCPDTDQAVNDLAAAMTRDNPRDRWAYARSWIAVRKGQEYPPPDAYKRGAGYRGP
jgi:hypothetical protein